MKEEFLGKKWNHGYQFLMLGRARELERSCFLLLAVAFINALVARKSFLFAHCIVTGSSMGMIVTMCTSTGQEAYNYYPNKPEYRWLMSISLLRSRLKKGCSHEKCERYSNRFDKS